MKITRISCLLSHFLLQQVFSVLLQICIGKMSHVKTLLARSHQQHQQQTNHTQASSTVSSDILLAAQNAFCSIMSLCLDALLHYAPDLTEYGYMTRLDEYRLIVATNFTQPSSFDLTASFSFGSILWTIDYCLKILQKVNNLKVFQHFKS